MYNLFYWGYSANLMCTFDSYSDCKKAHEYLIAKYPESKIWFSKVETISSFEEWADKFNGEIRQYKGHVKTNESVKL